MSVPSRCLLIVCCLLLCLTPGVRAENSGVGYYPNGQLQWEYLFQNGEVREAKWYDELGRLSARALYSGTQQTLSEGYRSDGSLAWQSRVLTDGREDVTRFGTGRRPEMRYQTVDGQVEGESTLYQANGLPRQVVTFHKGIPDGPARTFYEDGRLESEYSYRQGQLDGPYRSYARDGAPLAEALFENGTPR